MDTYSVYYRCPNCRRGFTAYGFPVGKPALVYPVCPVCKAAVLQKTSTPEPGAMAIDAKELIKE